MPKPDEADHGVTRTDKPGKPRPTFAPPPGPPPPPTSPVKPEPPKR